MWKEFKAFAFKGNVIDMAVGVIIGGAFGKIVSSVVNDLFMPIIGWLTSGTDFSALKIQLSPDAAIAYGSFIQNVINFLIIATCIFFFVKAINKLDRRKKKEVEEAKAADPAPSEVELLAEIRDLLKAQEAAANRSDKL